MSDSDLPPILTIEAEPDTLAALLERSLTQMLVEQEQATRDSLRAQIIAASTTEEADVLLEEVLGGMALVAQSTRESIHATIRIRLKEHNFLPEDGWTAQSDLRVGVPYTYATDGILVTVDWE